MALYHLDVHDNPSMNMKTLLGISPKFYVQPRWVQISNTIRMIDRFKKDLRQQDYLMSNIFDEDEEIQTKTHYAVVIIKQE